MRRWGTLIYGFLCALIGLGTLSVLPLFLANIVIARTVDQGEIGTILSSWPLAVAVDLGLLAVFGVQHSLMARDRFKAWWLRFVPQPVERSTYVLASSLAMILLYCGWRPLPEVMWSVGSAGMEGLLNLVVLFGWLISMTSMLSMGAADLTGLQQVIYFFRGQEPPQPRFAKPGFYAVVRHPIMLGLLIAFWAAPVMTIGRFLFAATMSLYILIGIAFEERALLRQYGEAYKAYQKDVAMLIPFLNGKGRQRRKPRWSPTDL